MNFRKYLFSGRLSHIQKQAVIMLSVLGVYIMIQVWHDTARPSMILELPNDMRLSLRYQNVTHLRTTISATVYTSPSPISRIDKEVRPAFLFTPLLGRFGNNLFQYASTFGIARATNRIQVVELESLSVLARVVQGITAPVKKLRAGHYLYTQAETGAGTFQKHLLLNTTNDTKICCFLQSWKYFDKYAEEIRKEFTIKDKLVMSAKTKMKVLIDLHMNTEQIPRTTNSIIIPKKPQKLKSVHDLTIIGIHVRRQDFTTAEMNKRGYFPAPKSYFFKAMDYFRHRFNNTLFIVCSDSPSWAMENLRNNSDGIVLSDIQFVNVPTNEDFALLALCNHVIISVGSYGWWAGWLSGGTVVYYNGWPKPGNEIGNQYDPDDYYYPEWIGLGD